LDETFPVVGRNCEDSKHLLYKGFFNMFKTWQQCWDKCITYNGKHSE